MSNFLLSQTENYYQLFDGTKYLRIYFINSKVVRFRYAATSNFERDFSYAIDSNHYLDQATNILIYAEEAEMRFYTDDVIIQVNKESLMIEIKNHEGKSIIKDSKPIHFESHYENGTIATTIERLIDEGEHFYGLGDKPEHPDLRGKKYTIWGTDQYGYYRHTDPLYKNIPFYLGLHNYLSYGIFLDNTYKSHFDFGKKEHHTLSCKIEGGEMNYYFIYGPEMIDVSATYTNLTGVPELPPLWALGFHQCKWSYYPDTQVMDVAQKMRAYQIPCDVIYLDIDYMDGFRCFTWDKEKFPKLKEMIAELKNMGFRTVVIIDPGIKIDENYWVYQEGLKHDYFCHKGEGGLINGKVWPGECYFPDYTNPEVRSWWADLFKGLIEEQGVEGVWNDMNEPALFDVPNKSFPDNVRHHFDGEACSHRKAHNVYGMQMSRATYEGVKNYNKQQRPFVITRSTYSGGQRYSSVWTGDNIASWEHIWIANVQTQRLAISGFSFVGSDIGGFIDPPTGEMIVRWMQMSCLHPFCRIHSSGDHGDQEPWSFGEESRDLLKKFIELRYSLMSYIYTIFYQYIITGKPMLRPIYMVDQLDFHTHYRSDEVCLGDHILFAPVYEEKCKERSLYFPKGEWYHYWTNQLYQGNKEYIIETPLDQSLLFIKAGAMIPQNQIMNYTQEIVESELTLLVYYKSGNEKSFLYEDSGNGYGYANGDYLYKTFDYDFVSNQIKITQTQIGNYDSPIKTYQFKLIGFKNVRNIWVDGKELFLSEILKVSAGFKMMEVHM